MTKSRSML